MVSEALNVFHAPTTSLVIPVTVALGVLVLRRVEKIVGLRG